MLRQADYLKDIEVTIPSLHQKENNIWRPKRVQVCDRLGPEFSEVVIGCPFLIQNKIIFHVKKGLLETPSMRRHTYSLRKHRKPPKRCGCAVFKGGNSRR